MNHFILSHLGQDRALDESEYLTVTFDFVPNMLTEFKSFAWMEMTKTLATLFKLFSFERAINAPTILREGFFLKAEECKVILKLR